MDNYEVSSSNSRAIRLQSTIAESDVDGTTFNPVWSLAAERSAEGSHLKSKNILLAHRSYDYADLLVEDSARRGQGRRYDG